MPLIECKYFHEIILNKKKQENDEKILTPVNWQQAGISTFTKFFLKKQEMNVLGKYYKGNQYV